MRLCRSLWFEQACRRYSRLSFRYASSDCSHVVGLRSQRREFSRPIGRFATERKELRIVADQIGAPTSTKTIAEAVTNLIPSHPLRRQSVRKFSLKFSSAVERIWNHYPGLGERPELRTRCHHDPCAAKSSRLNEALMDECGIWLRLTEGVSVAGRDSEFVTRGRSKG
jgi:hypothetical protein